MIVRIATVGQYRLPDADAGRLNELDNQAVAAAEAGDEQRFGELFAAMIELVRNHGEPVADEEIESSDVIVPPPDSTLADVAAEFTGEGLIPD